MGYNDKQDDVLMTEPFTVSLQENTPLHFQHQDRFEQFLLKMTVCIFQKCFSALKKHCSFYTMI